MKQWKIFSAFVAVFLHALAFLLLLAPGAALATFLPASFLTLPRSFWIVPLSALIAYPQFYLRWAAPEVGAVVAPSVLGLAVAAALQRAGCLRRALVADGFARPYIAMFTISLAYVLLLGAADTGLGAWAATYRFLPASWSSDNQVPQVVAEAVAAGASLDGLLGPWLVSDRPPLLTALQLAQRELWLPLLALGGSERLLPMVHQHVGIAAST